MSLISKLQNKAQNVTTKEQDFISSRTVPTNVYDAVVRVMYLDSAKSGAMFCAVEVLLNVDGRERSHKETIYISNKEGDVTYKDKKTGDDMPMPGYVMVDTLCKLVTGKGLAALDTEVKKIKVYNPATRTEENMDKEIFMDLLKAKVKVGIIEQTVDKQTKNESTGVYEATGETRDENVISKFFDEDGKTINEKAAGAEVGFINTWIENFKGKKLNKAKGAKAGSAGAVAGKPQAPAAQAGSSLF